MAEEAVLVMICKEPALFEKTSQLQEQMFSAPVLGKAFGQLHSRYRQGLEVSAAVLSDLTAEEMSHIAGLASKDIGPVNEQALDDCIRTIRAEYEKKQVDTDDDLRAFQRKLQESKGTR
jgi:DNA primase